MLKVYVILITDSVSRSSGNKLLNSFGGGYILKSACSSEVTLFYVQYNLTKSLVPMWKCVRLNYNFLGDSKSNLSFCNLIHIQPANWG